MCERRLKNVALCGSMPLTASLVIGRPSNSGGFDLLRSFLRDRDFIIVGENDMKADGRCPGREGAEGLAQRRANAIHKDVRWTLPPSKAKDVRDWLRAHGGHANGAHALKEAGAALVNQLNRSAIQLRKVQQPQGEYHASEDGLFREKPTRDGTTTIQLCSFNARIVGQTIRDDGTETQHKKSFEVQA